MPKLSKKKQDELLRDQHEARIRAALHWTETAEEPDVPPPQGWRELNTGYVFNLHYLCIEEACSSSHYHSIGRTDKTTYQRPLSLYSTRLRALLALRNAVERECAERLAKIDQMIEEESNESIPC